MEGSKNKVLVEGKKLVMAGDIVDFMKENFTDEALGIICSDFKVANVDDIKNLTGDIDTVSSEIIKRIATVEFDEMIVERCCHSPYKKSRPFFFVPLDVFRRPGNRSGYSNSVVMAFMEMDQDEELYDFSSFKLAVPSNEVDWCFAFIDPDRRSPDED